MAQISLRLLGGFDLEPAGSDGALPKKSRALLTFLGSPPGRSQPRDRLATLLWGESGEDQARQSLRQALSTLRSALPPTATSALRIERETVALDSEAVEVDVVRFERLVAKATLPALEEAAGLYAGDLLDGFSINEPAFDEWLTAERERLRGLAIGAFDRLLTHHAAVGLTRATETAHRLLTLNPLPESAHRSLMGLYLRQGRRDEAIRQYRTCADLLWRELGTRPSEETERLSKDIQSASATEGPVTSGKRSVLVVEDESVTLTALTGLLEQAGYEAVGASDGAEALFHLGDRRFDVILSDVRMPLLDGMQLLEITKEKKIDAPLIVVTDTPGSDVERKALELGAADYITKPIREDVLLLRIKRVLDRADG